MVDTSADLGAGVLTTFRLVTFPMLRGALLAGAILVVVSIIPIYLSQKLAGETATGGRF
ncbi:unannotated protein [freshwater metagenome]|uniref:Unannotated protein n=1 Tax=freshwater metagenome TaxID=449393 RepID=A0A6J7DZC8_9ZZZZ